MDAIGSGPTQSLRIGMPSGAPRRLWDPGWPAAVAFLAPNFIGFLCFTLLPVGLSLVMAFHHWTLRPDEAVELVGLRNFADLLGVRRTGPGSLTVALGYGLATAALLLGVFGSLVANVRGWSGTRPAGAVIALTGLAVTAGAVVSAARVDGGNLAFWTRESTQGLCLAGSLALLCGLVMSLREEATWRVGLGTVPGLLVALAAVAFWQLHDPMWLAYEPRDGRFWYYLYNTAFLMMGLPVAVGGALSLALLLNRELPLGPSGVRFRGAALCAGLALISAAVGLWLGWPNVGVLAALVWLFAGLAFMFNIVTFRTIFYLPQFTSGVAVYILWKSLYRPETGPINVALEAVAAALGWQAAPPSWLAEIAWAKPALVAMGVWIFIGGQNMLLYLAALSNVPQDLLDAADVDGAGPWQRFRHVTWPQLAPTTFFITVISIIGGLQGGFEQARVMTEGGPAGSTTALSYYIYNKMFQDLDMGYAAAISWILFALIFVATSINWKFGRSVEVEG